MESLMTGQTGLAELLRAIAARKGFVLIFGALPFACFTAAVLLVPPSYQAQALLELLPTRQEGPLSDPLGTASVDAIAIDTEVNKMTAEPIARAAYAKTGAAYAATLTGLDMRQKIMGLLAAVGLRPCRDVPLWLRAVACPTTEIDNASVFRSFRDALIVEPIRGSRLLRLSFTATDPKVAAEIVNVYVG